MIDDLTYVIIVNETTTDIICVKCKQDCSDKGNEIVLCDQCGYGKHYCSNPNKDCMNKYLMTKEVCS